MERPRSMEINDCVPNWARISQNQFRINIVEMWWVSSGRGGWVSALDVVSNCEQILWHCHVELGHKSSQKITKKSNKLCGEGLTLIYLHKRRYPSS